MRESPRAFRGAVLYIVRRRAHIVATMTFRIGNIPVQVHGSFFFTMLIFGMGDLKMPALLAVWVVGAFVAVLAHELGHALAGRMFGLSPAIQLHGMGGTTSWTAGKRLPPAKNLVVSFAGPFVGLLLGIPLYLVLTRVALPGFQSDAVWRLVQVTLGWSLLNLLPIVPLDGGNITMAFFQLFTPKKGETIARVISIVVALMVGAAALVFMQGLFPVLMAGLFIFQNVKALRANGSGAAGVGAGAASASAVPKVDEAQLAAALGEAYAALDREDGATAIRLTEPVLVHASSAELKVTAIRVLAYARMLEGHWGHVMSILERFSPVIGQEDMEKFERTATELGRSEDASRIRTLRLAEAGGPQVSGFRA